MFSHSLSASFEWFTELFLELVRWLTLLPRKWVRESSVTEILAFFNSIFGSCVFINFGFLPKTSNSRLVCFFLLKVFITISCHCHLITTFLPLEQLDQIHSQIAYELDNLVFQDLAESTHLYELRLLDLVPQCSYESK